MNTTDSLINAVELRPEHVGSVIEYQTLIGAGPDGDIPETITVRGTLTAVQNGGTMGRAWSRVTVDDTTTSVLGAHRTVRVIATPKAA